MVTGEVRMDVIVVEMVVAVRDGVGIEVGELRIGVIGEVLIDVDGKLWLTVDGVLFDVKG